jgi:GT2 family glycosyltransferase
VDSILKYESNINDKIIIVDNDSDEQNVKIIEAFLKEKGSNVILIRNEHNVGYFGGLNIGLRYVKDHSIPYDVLIIGNNDLNFPINFKSMIFKSSELFKKYPVISPNIITLDGEHQNPHVIHRISVVRELLYDMAYLNYYLFLIIKILAKFTQPLTDRKDETKNDVAQEIYQGHGACYILTPLFFEYFSELDNKSFLFYEEFFLSQQLQRAGYKYYYEPDIKIVHRLHSSTSLQPRYNLWRISCKAHWEHRKLNPIF